MGSFSEIGLLLLLIVAFSVPVLQNVWIKHRGADKNDEEKV
jgi:hypothetical protein